jgi:hypothetical protein
MADKSTRPRKQVGPRLRQTKRDPDPGTWVESDVGDGWRAAFRMLIQDGLPVVGEVRVYPAEDDALPGRWSATTAPTGGVTTRLLRRVHIDAARERFDEMRSSGFLLGPHPAAPDLDRIRYHATHNPGRGGHPDGFYAAAAAAYVTHLHTGATKPTEALAAELDLPPWRVRDLVRAARTRGLFTQPPRGRAGGELTPAGHAALTAWNPTKEAPR